MPTVIDTLVLKIGFDTSMVQTGKAQVSVAMQTVRQEASATARAMQVEGARAADYFGQIKQQALGLIGLLTGGMGIQSSAARTIGTLSELGRAATAIGLSVQELSAFGNMIARNGGNAATAVGEFRKMTDELEKWKLYGKSDILPFFNTIGAIASDSPMAVFMKFVDFAERNKGNAQLVTQIGQGLGFSDPTINEARKGRRQVEEDLARSQALGVATKEMTDAMIQLQEKTVGLRQAFEHLADVTLVKVSSGLSTWLDQLATDVGKLAKGDTPDPRKINPDLTKDLDTITENSVVKGLLKFFKNVLSVGNPDTAVEALTGKGGPNSGELGPGSSKGWQEEWLNFLKDRFDRDAAARNPMEWWGYILNGGANGGQFRPSIAGAPSGAGPGGAGGGPGPGGSGAGGATPTPGAGPRVASYSGNDPRRNAAEAASMAFWTSKGLTPEQAAGMVAQEMQESGGNPGARGDGGTAHGIHQWHADRRAAILAGTGIDVSTASVEDQRRAAYWEITQGNERRTGVWERLQRETTAGGAGRTATGYERPGLTADVQERERVQRAAEAERILARHRRTGGAGPRTGDTGTIPPVEPVFRSGAGGNGGNSVEIGDVHVHTHATDSGAISRDMRRALANEMIVQSDRGLA